MLVRAIDIVSLKLRGQSKKENSMDRIQRIAVVGLGAMGSSLATHLLAAGYHVTGYDINYKRSSALTSLGLHKRVSAREAVKGANLILLSLPNWDIVREVVEGENGLIGGLCKDQIIADTSTVPPWETKAMAERLAKKEIEWMDVPISGDADQAREKNMVFMVGGKKSVYNRVKPIFDKIGKKTVYVGKHGDAAMLKVIVNLTLFLNQAAAIEGLSLGLKSGVPAERILDVLVSGSASSDLLASRGRDMIQGNFRPRGPVWLAVKDIGLALESAKKLGVILPIAGLYQQLLLNAHYRGWDREDATAVMKIYMDLADINISSARAHKK